MIRDWPTPPRHAQRRLRWAIRRALDGIDDPGDEALARLIPDVDVDPYREVLAARDLHAWYQRHACDPGCRCRPPGRPSKAETVKRGRRS